MTRRGARSVVVSAVTLWALLGTVTFGQSGARNGEWRTYGGDLGNTRYAPLDQINRDNFKDLEIAWRFKTDSLGPRPEYNFQSTPLMVNGRLFSTAGSRRAVVALDAGTGELLWMHSENEGARGEAAPRQLSGRGLAYWTDGRDERILYVTPGYRLIALDAKTGVPGLELRESGRRRLEVGRRPGDRPCDGRGRTSRRAGRGEGHDHHRSGPPRELLAQEQDERQRLRARLRRPHREAILDLPHHSTAGRVRGGNVGRQGVARVHGQYRCVGADQRRRGARPRLSAGGVADGRFLRRASAR